MQERRYPLHRGRGPGNTPLEFRPIGQPLARDGDFMGKGLGGLAQGGFHFGERRNDDGPAIHAFVYSRGLAKTSVGTSKEPDAVENIADEKQWQHEIHVILVPKLTLKVLNH